VAAPAAAEAATGGRIQTREQQYAVRVFTQVDAVKQAHKDKDDPYRTKYGAMAHRLPVLIRTAGLVQALAFLQTRDEKEAAWHDLLGHLAITVGYKNGAALAAQSRNADLGAYMQLTAKVLAALVWYKRFAESVLNVKSGAEVADDAPPDGATAQANSTPAQEAAP